MDFTGKGYITEDDFLDSMIMSRITYTQEDVKIYTRQSNIFRAGAH